MDVVKQTPSTTIQSYSFGGDMQKSNFSHSHHDKLNFKHSGVSDSLDKKDVLRLVDELNQTSKSLEVSVKFAFNDKLGEVYVNVIDNNSGEVLRQIPSKEALKLKEAMKEYVGSIIDIKG